MARTDSPVRELGRRFPGASVAGCSTAGEILQNSVRDDSVVALAIQFAHTRVRAESVALPRSNRSFESAAALGARLAAPDLRHVLVLSDGLGVNGTPLTRGFRAALPAPVSLTGGLAGDSLRFRRTLVGLGDDIGPGRIVAIGFYGDRLQVGFGTGGGWSPFGPRRLVTRSYGNVLHELDGQPALALYKRYLGDRAQGLPGTGFLFPLQLLPRRDATDGLVRSILAVDEATQSLVFAGDLPEGHYVRLMKSSLSSLVGGASSAAETVSGRLPAGSPRFAVLVSCVGRRVVLGQRVEEEVDATLGLLRSETPTIGFYAYGEICPLSANVGCDLHNQTMAVTVFAETGGRS